MLCGIFGYMINAAQSVPDPSINVGGGYMVNVNTGMNNLMDKAWVFLPIIVLIVSISWLFMSAQKEKWGGSSP